MRQIELVIDDWARPPEPLFPVTARLRLVSDWSEDLARKRAWWQNEITSIAVMTPSPLCLVTGI
jgi:hypothetical protein